MAEGEVFAEPNSEEDVAQGLEPGASRQSILISDSYEDLSYDLDELLQINEAKKLRSGTISRIRKGEDASPIPTAVQNSNHLVEESTPTSSNRTTPSIDLNHDVSSGVIITNLRESVCGASYHLPYRWCHCVDLR